MHFFTSGISDLIGFSMVCFLPPSSAMKYVLFDPSSDRFIVASSVGSFPFCRLMELSEYIVVQISNVNALNDRKNDFEYFTKNCLGRGDIRINYHYSLYRVQICITLKIRYIDTICIRIYFKFYPN